jgi:hypothetical protein
MIRNLRFPNLLIDLAGGAISVFLLLVAAWLGVIRQSDTASERDELISAIADTRENLFKLRRVRDAQQDSLNRMLAEGSSRGPLPDRAPVESYLQALAGLCAQHHVNVVSQHPLSPRNYPGLLEQRYAYDISGTAPDLLRFLRAIESLDYWCDVSYLSLERSQTHETQRMAKGAANLTLSLFSSSQSTVMERG